MKVLFATGSPARYMLPPQLGEEQVNCGPDWANASAPDGRVTSLATPVGNYDLAAVAGRLPADQQPDVVVCLVDASWRNLPRNLAAFKVPRVLLVADTHHQKTPLIGMLRYLASETFDRVVFLYDRHHAAFFHAAGFRNLYWFPGLTFPHSDAAVQAARQARREARVAFVGQAGNLHPRRGRLLGALHAGGIQVAQQALPQPAALRFYGQSLLGFNASLNGDLNLRVFEVMAAGAGLLTDRLAPASGLGQLFTAGRELAVYDDGATLAEQARHFLSEPVAAQAMGTAGARWFDEHLGENQRRSGFRALAFDGVAPAAFGFTAAEATQVFFAGDTDRLLQSMMVYEGAQELHRTQEKVRVSLDATAPADLALIYATLPRIELGCAGDGLVPDLAVFGRANLTATREVGAAHLWCHDAQPGEIDELAAGLAPAGYTLASRDVAVFGRAAAAAPAPAVTPAAMVTQARELFRGGNHAGALALARTALARDGRCFGALVLLGELALTCGGGPLAEKLFRQALEVQPGEPGVEVLLGDALRVQGKLRPAAACFERALRKRPSDLPALLALARLRTADHQLAAAETALRTAVRHHPQAPAAAQALADFLKRGGQLLEALAWHRRALGCADAIPPPAAAGRRRALFVVQHASTWTSMASIVAAFRADPQWQTTLVALPYNHPYLPNPADRAAIFGFLEKEGEAFVRWDNFKLEAGCADVLFLQNPYDVTRPEGWRTPDLLRIVPRLAYAPYAIEIGGTIEDATNQFNLPLQNLAWAVFARSEEHRALFARHGRVGNAHVIATGHPKFDLLCQLATQPRDPELAAFARGRPLVLWNPHFDIRPDGSGYSTFLTWQKFLTEEFARRPDLALVIRPHPLFFTTLESRRLLTRAQIDDFLARGARAGNILIDRRPSYLAVFAAADALISDGASFLIEYGVTGKPVCYLHNSSGPLAHLHYEIDLDFVRQQCTWAEREDDIRQFLDEVRPAGGAAQAERAAAARQQLAVNPAGAGVAIKQAVDARLDAETGAARPALQAV